MVYVSYYIATVITTIMCWSSYLMWWYIVINVQLINVFLSKYNKVYLVSQFYPWILSFAIAFTLITCSISTLSNYVCVFWMCICAELSCTWCVSLLVSFLLCLFHYLYLHCFSTPFLFYWNVHDYEIYSYVHLLVIFKLSSGWAYYNDLCVCVFMCLSVCLSESMCL